MLFRSRKHRAHAESPLLRWASAAYTPTLRAALRRPLVVMLVATLSLGGAVFILANRGSEFLPELNEGALYITMTLPSNVSLTEGRRYVPTISKIIEGFPEVEVFMSQLGRPEDGTDPTMPNNLEFFVKLRPASEWPAGTTTLSDLIGQMSGALSVIPGMDINFSQPIRDNVKIGRANG